MIEEYKSKQGTDHATESGFVHFWSNLQDLLAEIIHTNLALVAPDAKTLIEPSRITDFCYEFIRLNPEVEEGDTLLAPYHCVTKAVARCREESFREMPYQCEHDFCFHLFPVQDPENPESWMILVVGPYLIGERGTEKHYREFCGSRRLDPELFCDQVREIRVYSQDGIEYTVNFIRNLLQGWDAKQDPLKKISFEDTIFPF